jgi:hypothetical protein
MLPSTVAGSRAWLEAANQIKRREDTQLKLIIRNIPSIKSSDTTYANVVENWVVAMTAIQKSIEGVPQDISNAAVLLGLMSWHIYPDINVFSPIRYVEFHGTFIPTLMCFLPSDMSNFTTLLSNLGVSFHWVWSKRTMRKQESAGQFLCHTCGFTGILLSSKGLLEGIVTV